MSNKDASVKQLYDKDYNLIYPILHFTEEATVSKYDGSISDSRFKDVAFGYGVGRFVKLDDDDYPILRADDKFKDQLKAFKNNDTKNYYRINIFSDALGNLCGFIPGDFSSGAGGSDDTPGGEGSDSAGQEFIFARSNDGKAPLIEYDINSKEYQEDNYVPNDWFDHPQGIDSSEYRYEFVSTRKKENNEWGDFSDPAIWAKWGEDGKDGDGVEYVYILTNSNDNPGLIIPDDWEDSDSSYQTSEYKPDSNIKDVDGNVLKWTDNYNQPNAYARYSWVAIRKYNSGFWEEFSEPKLWNIYKVAGKSAVDVYRRSDMILDESSLPKYNDGSILYYQFSTDKFFNEDDIEITEIGSGDNMWHHDPPSSSDDVSLKYLYRSSAMVDIIDMETPVEITEDMWKGPLFESANGDKGERGTSISVTGRFDSSAALKKAYKYYLISNDMLSGEMPDKPSQYFKDDKLSISDGYITADDGNLWLYSAENIGYSEFDEFFDNNWTNLGKIQGDSAYLYTAYGYRDSNGDIHFTKDEQGTMPFGTIEGPLFGVHTTSTKYEDTFPNSDDQVNLFTWSKWRGEDGYGYEQIFILHNQLIDYTNEDEPLKVPQYEDFGYESEDGTIKYKYTLAEWNARDFVPDVSGLAEGTFWSDTPFSPSFDLPYCYTAIRKVPGIDDENIPNEFHGSFDGVEYSNKPILFSSLSEAKSIYHIELSNEFDQIYVNDQNKVEYEQVFDIDCDIYKDQDIINDEIIDASVILNNIVENTICDISIRRDDASIFKGFTLTFKKDAKIDSESLIFNIKVDINNDFSLSDNFKLIRYSSTTDYDLWVSNSVIHLVFGDTGWRPSLENIEWGIKAKIVGVTSEVKNLTNIPDDCSVQIWKSGKPETISSGRPIGALDVSDIEKSGNVIQIQLRRNGMLFDYIDIECVSDGIAGPQGLGEERIYTLTQDSTAPTIPKGAGSAYTTDEWNAVRFVPDGWSFIPPSPDTSNPYCWYAVRQTPTDNPTEYNEFKGTTSGDKEYAILNNIYNESVANSQYSLELSNEFEQVFVDGEYRIIKTTSMFQPYQTFETTLSLFEDGVQQSLGEKLEFDSSNAISNLTVTFTGASERANSLPIESGGMVGAPGISNSSIDYGKLLTWDDNYNAAYIAILSNDGSFISDVNDIKGLENIRFKICFSTLKLNKSTNSILFTLTLNNGEKLEKRLDLISIASDTDYDLNVSPTYIHKTSDGLYVPSEIDVKIESRNIINDSATKILNTIPKGYSIRHKFGQNGTINTQSGGSSTKINTIKIDSDDTVIIELLKDTSIIDHVEVQVIKDGQDGVVPDISEIKAPILYPAGIWNSETTYEKTIDSVPYVYHKSDNDQDDGNYYILNSSTSTNNEPDFQQNNIEYWKIMDKYESIYTEIGIIENGTIGEAVFNNDFMFSQTGIYNTDYSISLYKRSSTIPILTNRNLSVDELISEGWTEEVPTGSKTLYIISAIKGTTTNTAEGIVGTEWKGPYTEDNISEFNNSRFNSTEYQLFNNENPYGENEISENKWKPVYCVDLNTGRLWCGAGNVKFSDDGSGELAGGKISWDAAGNLYFPITGTMQASYKYNDLKILGLSYSLSLNGGHFGDENGVTLKAYDASGNELISENLVVMSPSTVVGILDIKNATSLKLYYDSDIIARVDNIEIPEMTVLKHNIIIYDSSNYLTANCIGCQNGVLYINDDDITYEIAPNGSKDYVELSTEITNTNNSVLSNIYIAGDNCTVYDTSLKILGNSSKIIKTKILKDNKNSLLIINNNSSYLKAHVSIENEFGHDIYIDVKNEYMVEKLNNGSWRIYITIENRYTGIPEDAEYDITLYTSPSSAYAGGITLIGGDIITFIDVNSDAYGDSKSKFLLNVEKH